MRAVLKDIQSGKFTKEWMKECETVKKTLLKWEDLAKHPIEKVKIYDHDADW